MNLLLIDFETYSVKNFAPIEFHAVLVEVNTPRRATHDPDPNLVTKLAECGGFLDVDADDSWKQAKFHQESGLVEAYEKASVKYTQRGVACKLLRMLDAHPGQPLLCARNVAFERRILEHHFPEVVERLHPYRNVDMSSFNIMPCAREIYEAQHVYDAHRAKGDCQRELAILRRVVEAGVR